MPFVLLKRGNRTRSIVDQYCSKHSFKPKIALETENTATTLAMAQEGMGIAVCPELFLRVIHVKSSQTTAEGLDLFPLSAASAVSRLVIGYRRDRYLSHYAERFISIAQETLGK